MIFKSVLLFLAAYLVGSIPWGVILARIFCGIDVMSQGSKNIGAYNVFRLTGLKLGVTTLVGDMLKGAMPVLVGLSWFGLSNWKGQALVCLVSLSAVVGHMFSVFLGFKGGKGVATSAGCLLVISPVVFLVCLMTYVLVVCCWGYSSAGSLSAAAILPVAMWISTYSAPQTMWALVLTVLIFICHTDNIKRLVNGTEHSSFR